MLPVFMFFLFAFAKVYALLMLIQKMEIASYYAARRWQLESHRNVDFEGDDSGPLMKDINRRVSEYLGYDTAIGKFMNLKGKQADIRVNRTQVWQVIILSVETNPTAVGFFISGPGPYSEQALEKGENRSLAKGIKLQVTKYVPNRDRPIKFILPGLQ